jgi:hypothetical protein
MAALTMRPLSIRDDEREPQRFLCFPAATFAEVREKQIQNMEDVGTLCDRPTPLLLPMRLDLSLLVVDATHTDNRDETFKDVPISRCKHQLQGRARLVDFDAAFTFEQSRCP